APGSSPASPTRAGTTTSSASSRRSPATTSSSSTPATSNSINRPPSSRRANTSPAARGSENRTNPSPAPRNPQIPPPQGEVRRGRLSTRLPTPSSLPQGRHQKRKNPSPAAGEARKSLPRSGRGAQIPPPQ